MDKLLTVGGVFILCIVLYDEDVDVVAIDDSLNETDYLIDRILPKVNVYTPLAHLIQYFIQSGKHRLDELVVNCAGS